MVSPRTQATLLLTARIAASSTDQSRPLDVAEWNRLARWLAAKDLAPEDLVQGEIDAILEDWDDRRIEKDRLLVLLDRGHSLALMVERWLGTGMWMLGRSDDDYPQRLREHLKDSAPPLIFGYGDVRHFRNKGVAIVGSRDAPESDLLLAESLGRATSLAGYNVVSGGARGVDDRAANGAFGTEGTVIAVIADSLLRNASKKQYRDRLIQGDLVLMTPYSPEAGFSAGNAMGRNRLIYCLADAAVAVSSSNGTGGTFGGASNNLRAGWVPLWVAPTDNPESGNPALVEQGAGWLPSREHIDIDALFAWPEPDKRPDRIVQNSLF
jgi:predicted Rossmann fold nucleotide-binding protein DprA/Smf involved in DNA uptake